MTKRLDVNILLAGEAGQGIQTAGEILVRAAVRYGYSVFASQTYESRIRGGHNTFSVRLHPKGTEAPTDLIDLLVAFYPDAIPRHTRNLAPGALVILPRGMGPIEPPSLEVPYEDLGTEGFINIAAIGVVAYHVGIPLEVMQRSLQDLSKGAAKERVEKDLLSLRRAYQWASENSSPLTIPGPNPTGSPRLVLNGNEAISLGAVSAGVRFCAFYPMSPSTSIALNLAAWAGKMGIIVEQAEDEIAAINMAIGASFGGAPSIVPTSGGGFALMTEAVSLAGISETPVVVVIAQRPGPATGLPTRTEQGDLLFVIHSGHGEFPKAVFAPGNHEECFSLTRIAIQTAERYQVPTFVLSDHFLADSYRDVNPFDVGALPWVRAGVEIQAVPRPYLRYRITEDGVSPRLIPGLSEELVIGDSHEHAEDGHITEDLSLRPKMVQKRLRKHQGLLRESLPPSRFGADRPELLLVCWGSTLGAAREAVEKLSAKGVGSGLLHFPQVWPIDPARITPILSSSRRVVSVEGNATGQLARLIRMTTGFEIKEMVLRYDGLPITPEYIVNNVNV